MGLLRWLGDALLSRVSLRRALVKVERSMRRLARAFAFAFAFERREECAVRLYLHCICSLHACVKQVCVKHKNQFSKSSKRDTCACTAEPSTNGFHSTHSARLCYTCACNTSSLLIILPLLFLLIPPSRPLLNLPY